MKRERAREYRQAIKRVKAVLTLMMKEPDSKEKYKEIGEMLESQG